MRLHQGIKSSSYRMTFPVLRVVPIDSIVSHAIDDAIRVVHDHEPCSRIFASRDRQDYVETGRSIEWFRDGNHVCCRHETIPSTPVTPLSTDSTSPLSPTSAYFTTSEGKARFLTRYSREVTVEGLTRQEDSLPVIPTDSLDLRQKKVRNFLWKRITSTVDFYSFLGYD